MDGREAVLAPRDVQQSVPRVDLVPAQADKFGHASAVPVGRQDQRGGARAVPTAAHAAAVMSCAGRKA
jgi:hypothetical protein